MPTGVGFASLLHLSAPVAGSEVPGAGAAAQGAAGH